MLITYSGLCDLVERGVMTGVPDRHINAASVDVTLGRWLWAEDSRGGVVDLAYRQTPGMIQYDLNAAPYRLDPGEFVLAQTAEIFNLPDDVAAEFRLRSSMARAGLDQALAVWCDPGWNGSALTLELRNNLQHHAIVLTAGLRVGQMVFFRSDPVPAERSYRTIGRYNGDANAQPSKGAY